jgi:hypothetical protein
MSEDNTDKPCFGVAACYQLGIVVTAQRNNTLYVHTHSPELGWTHAYVSTPAVQAHGWSHALGGDDFLFVVYSLCLFRAET